MELDRYHVVPRVGGVRDWSVERVGLVLEKRSIVAALVSAVE